MEAALTDLCDAIAALYPGVNGIESLDAHLGQINHSLNEASTTGPFLARIIALVRQAYASGWLNQAASRQRSEQRSPS